MSVASFFVTECKPERLSTVKGQDLLGLPVKLSKGLVTLAPQTAIGDLKVLLACLPRARHAGLSLVGTLCRVCVGCGVCGVCVWGGGLDPIIK